MTQKAIDRTLLDKEGAITVPDLMAFFQTNDYTSTGRTYDIDRADRTHGQLFPRPNANTATHGASK